MIENTPDSLSETVVPDRSPPSASSHDPARPAAGVQLLFGIIALQNHFITREQLLAALDAWVQDKSRAIADLLHDQRALSSPHREILDRLVALFLEKHHGKPEQSLAALSSVAEVRIDLERLQDPDLAHSLRHVASHAENTATISVVSRPESSRGRFRIVRPHAQGGLGQVSVAVDQDLNREVALKEILPRHADDPTSRERFVLEAEITGGLEHPGIVPVYALGQAPDGRPFYAMRFIKGDSLKTAIDAYHHPDNPSRKDRGARELELRQLLGRFIDVCNAMEYAHSRGVLHRDLKPGNIMVGKYGETLVVDWGLAKAVGRQEIVSDEASIRPTSALSSSGQTQPGSALGTPAYMSPEQARGELDRLGPLSDVYSLGATLYHLLCGKPPFDKEQIRDVLSKVQQGAYARPRTVVRDVAPPLEAICLKAMALNPSDRYPSARAVADDLEHWLADEPVSAQAESVSDRLARWSRKHRAWVRSGGLALVLLLIGATAAAVLIEKERRTTKTLADRNGILFESEKKLKAKAQESQQLAEAQAATLRRALARQFLDHGLNEYAAGRVTESDDDFARAGGLAAQDASLLRDSGDLLADRISRGGRLLAPPLPQPYGAQFIAFGADGTHFTTFDFDGSVRHWDSLSGKLLADPRKHEEHAQCLAVDRDSRRYVMARQLSVQVRDASTGQSIGPSIQLPMQSQWRVAAAAISPDGSRIVTAGDFVRLWDAHTGRSIVDLPYREVHAIAFSPDGERFVTGSNAETALVWDAKTGKSLGQPRPETGAGLITAGTRYVVFSPDGTKVVTGHGSSARVWDGSTGAPLSAALPHSVSCAAFSPDGTRLITGGNDHIARLWNSATGERLGRPMSHQQPITCVAFSPDGSRIATGSQDRMAQVWDGWTGRPEGEPMRHGQAVTSLVFSPDSTRLVTGSLDQATRLWDLTVAAPLGERMSHDSEVQAIAFSPDGARIISTGTDNTVRVWNAGSGEPMGSVMRHPEAISCLVVSPDGSRIVTGSVDGGVRFWNTLTGKLDSPKPLVHQQRVSCVRYSPDGSRVVTGCADGQARIWDARTGQLRGELPHPQPIDLALFGKDQRMYTLTSGTVRIWDGTVSRYLEGLGPYWIGATVASPDGTTLLTACGDSAVRLWDGATGRVIGEPLKHDSEIADVRFSPDGKRWLTNATGTVRVWDAKTRQLIGEPLRHQGPVRRVEFSKDGTRIITCCEDGATRIWDAETGRPLGQPLWQRSHIQDLAISPDGSRIVTGGMDGAVRLWSVPRPQLTDAVHTLTCWTGARFDNEQSLHHLSVEEREKSRGAADDALSRSQVEGFERRRIGSHQWAAAEALDQGRWRTYHFHTQQLLNLQPDPAASTRLAMFAEEQMGIELKRTAIESGLVSAQELPQTENQAAEWTFDRVLNFQVAFEDDRERRLIGPSSLRARLDPYPGERANLILPKSRQAGWKLAGLKRLLFLVRTENSNQWQFTNPVITLHESDDRSLRLTPKADLLGTPSSLPLKGGWRLVAAPLHDDPLWHRQGAADVANWLTLGFDSYGKEPFTVWIDGLTWE